MVPLADESLGLLLRDASSASARFLASKSRGCDERRVGGRSSMPVLAAAGWGSAPLWKRCAGRNLDVEVPGGCIAGAARWDNGNRLTMLYEAAEWWLHHNRWAFGDGSTGCVLRGREKCGTCRHNSRERMFQKLSSGYYRLNAEHTRCKVLFLIPVLFLMV